MKYLWKCHKLLHPFFPVGLKYAKVCKAHVLCAEQDSTFPIVFLTSVLGQAFPLHVHPCVRVCACAVSFPAEWHEHVIRYPDANTSRCPARQNCIIRQRFSGSRAGARALTHMSTRVHVNWHVPVKPVWYIKHGDGADTQLLAVAAIASSGQAVPAQQICWDE